MTKSWNIVNVRRKKIGCAIIAICLRWRIRKSLTKLFVFVWFSVVCCRRTLRLVLPSSIFPILFSFLTGAPDSWHAPQFPITYGNYIPQFPITSVFRIFSSSFRDLIASKWKGVVCIPQKAISDWTNHPEQVLINFQRFDFGTGFASLLFWFLYPFPPFFIGLKMQTREDVGCWFFIAMYLGNI